MVTEESSRRGERGEKRKREKERFGLERLIGPLDEIKRRRRNERDKFCY